MHRWELVSTTSTSRTDRLASNSEFCRTSGVTKILIVLLLFGDKPAVYVPWRSSSPSPRPTPSTFLLPSTLPSATSDKYSTKSDDEQEITRSPPLATTTIIRQETDRTEPALRTCHGGSDGDRREESGTLRRRGKTERDQHVSATVYVDTAVHNYSRPTVCVKAQ